MSLLDRRYRLVQEIASGGMAEVWRAIDIRLDRTVAVKMLLPGLAGSTAARERAVTEARAVARIDHPNVAAIYDAGRRRRGLRRSLPYIVMEFVEGETLCQYLGSGCDPMDWRTALPVAVQVADALAAAHRHRVVHRDVKPGNIMLLESRVKLVDFGLAVLADVPPANRPRTLLGTPQYMAPEQIRGGPVGEAADMFAFGMLLYRMLTGSLPWNGTDIDELIMERLLAPVVRMPPAAGLPAEIVDLCDLCLANDPGDRPSSRQAARALRDVLGNST